MYSFICILPFISLLSNTMPLPWTSELSVTNPLTNNSKVLIATPLMSRCPGWPINTVPPTSVYDTNVSSAVKLFQKYNNFSQIDGIFGPDTANTTLFLYSDDYYIDNGIITAADYNASYKVHIKVYNDYHRDIEVIANLLDPNNVLLYQFK